MGTAPPCQQSRDGWRIFVASPNQVMRRIPPEPRLLAAGEARGSGVIDGRSSATSSAGDRRRRRCVEHLLVADRLAGGAGPAGAAARPRTSSTRPAAAMAANRCVDPLARSPARSTSQPGDAHREHRVAAVRRGRGRTTRTAGRWTGSPRGRARCGACCSARSATAADRVARSRSAYARGESGVTRVAGVDQLAELQVLAREAEVVDDRLHVEAGAADAAAPADHAPRCRRSRRAPRPGSGRPSSPRHGSATSIRWCGTRARSAGSASRCRCPCPGTPASSRSRRSRRRRAAPPTASASSDFPDAVGPTSARWVTAAQPAVTGMRVRAAARSVDHLDERPGQPVRRAAA